MSDPADDGLLKYLPSPRGRQVRGGGVQIVQIPSMENPEDPPNDPEKEETNAPDDS